MLYLVLLVVLFLLMFVYFIIADKLNIIDKPNER
ncbi:UDP-GlcNAc--UDP-phosphate GlcNAc-1-phosphate transferase, partial [Pedobacter sp. HMWF019]